MYVYVYIYIYIQIHRGRPKLRWEDGVMEDARKLRERNWRNAARNRDSWQKLLKKALTQKGLLCQWWWWWWWFRYTLCVFRQVQEKCSCMKHSYSSKCKKNTSCKEQKSETYSVYGQLFSSPDLLDKVHNTAIYCCGTVRQNQKGIPKNSVDYETKTGWHMTQ